MNTISAAMATPNGSELLSKTASKAPSDQAVRSAVKNPASIANPPTCGIGEVWTERSFGLTTHPRWRAIDRTSGVAPNVTIAATAPGR